MASNLIKIENKDATLNMNEIEIHPEEKLEKLLWENKAILPDIYLLSRQVPNYSGSDRIDLLGLDNDNNVVIIEVKDEEVDNKVIVQVMRYAFWVEENPDSIKSLWYEKKDGGDKIEFDWNQKLNIRVIIVGPEFNADIRKLKNKVNYPIELIEIKKFNDGKADFILVNQVKDEKTTNSKPSSLRYTGEYNEEFYASQRNPSSVPNFMKTAEKMENYIKSKGWDLTRNNNKNYISFKYGFPIVCGTQWTGSKSYDIFFKVKKEDYENFKTPQGFDEHGYEDNWKQAYFIVRQHDFDIKQFDKLFEAAYKNITGK